MYGLCANLCFLIHIILKFQESQLHIHINTKPNDKQKWSRDREKLHFFWLVTSLSMYLKSRGLCTDHKRLTKKSKRSALLVIFFYSKLLFQILLNYIILNILVLFRGGKLTQRFEKHLKVERELLMEQEHWMKVDTR